LNCIPAAKSIDNASKETTPFNQIFGGYMRQDVTCSRCRHVSTTFQHFMDLLLDIRQASSIDDALANFFRAETIGDGEG
jgi:ubiquitin carboxyl-terminal hydrolase 36/42